MHVWLSEPSTSSRAQQVSTAIDDRLEHSHVLNVITYLKENNKIVKTSLTKSDHNTVASLKNIGHKRIIPQSLNGMLCSTNNRFYFEQLFQR